MARSSSRKRTSNASAASTTPKKPRFTQTPPVRSHTNSRMSEAVSFNNVLYLAGQVDDSSSDIKGQTTAVLASIDKLLEENHTDKTKIIRAEIFIKNKSDFAGMNEIWEPWIGKHGPARATVQANLMKDEWLVEIVITAALCKDYPEEEVAEEEGVAEKAETESPKRGKRGGKKAEAKKEEDEQEEAEADKKEEE